MERKTAVLVALGAAVSVGIAALLLKRPNQSYVPNPAVRPFDTDYMQCLERAIKIVAPRDLAAAQRFREIYDKLVKLPAGDVRDRVAASMRVLDDKLTCLPEWEDEQIPGRTRLEGRKELGAHYTEQMVPDTRVYPVLSKAYPIVDKKIQARIVLGQTPASITGLTPAEAHQWLSTWDEHRTSPSVWLIRSERLRIWPGLDPNQAYAETRVLSVLNHIEVEMPVARWIVNSLRDPARRNSLFQGRTEQDVHGDVISGRWIDRVDELKTEDLRPSVRETFDRARARIMQETLQRLKYEEKRQKKPLAKPPQWWRPLRCARLLSTPSELEAEGRVMRHCVATYSPKVRSGRSVIVAIDVRGKRSTAEIDRRTIGVIQHKGEGNYTPPELCQRALNVCLQHWRATKGEL